MRVWRAPVAVGVTVGLMVVLLCAAVAGWWRWGEGDSVSEGAGGFSGPASTSASVSAPASTPAWMSGSATPPVAQAGPPDRVAPAPPPAAAVLAQVSAAGDRARRVALAPGPERAVSADELQARLAQNPAAVAATSAGKRVRVQGRLEGVELGEAGVVLLRLALAERPQGLRLVASPALAERAATWAQAGAAPPVLSLDCLSQGVMMGEWLLVDCLD